MNLLERKGDQLTQVEEIVWHLIKNDSPGEYGEHLLQIQRGNSWENKTITEQAFYYHDGWHTRSECHYRKNDPRLIAWACPPKGWRVNE